MHETNKRTVTVQRKENASKKRSSELLIPIISVFMLLFVVLIGLTVILINNSANNDDEPSATTTQTQSVIHTPGLSKIEDNREKPSLPSHINASLSNTAYRPANDPDAQSIVGITSDAAILVDLAENMPIAQKSPDYTLPIASMTKVMTLIVACDYLTDPDMLYATVSISLTDKLTGYNKAFVSTANPKASVYVIDLLYGLILYSGADCAYGLAEGLAGSEAAFVERMNQKAQLLGMSNTTFTNCVGKDDEGKNKSTMRDVATMFAYAMKNKLCYEILSTDHWECVGKYAECRNLYALVHTGIKNRCNNTMTCGAVTVKGGKSGNETMADYCLVSFAEDKNGKLYICVTAGHDNSSYADTVTIYKNYVN